MKDDSHRNPNVINYCLIKKRKKRLSARCDVTGHMETIWVPS